MTALPWREGGVNKSEAVGTSGPPVWLPRETAD